MAGQLTSRIGFEVIIINQAWLDAGLLSGDPDIITAYIVHEAKDGSRIWLCTEEHLRHIIQTFQFDEIMTPEIKTALTQLSVIIMNSDPNIISANPEWFPELEQIKEFIEDEEIYGIELTSWIHQDSR